MQKKPSLSNQNQRGGGNLNGADPSMGKAWKVSLICGAVKLGQNKLAHGGMGDAVVDQRKSEADVKS